MYYILQFTRIQITRLMEKGNAEELGCTKLKRKTVEPT